MKIIQALPTSLVRFWGLVRTKLRNLIFLGCPLDPEMFGELFYLALGLLEVTHFPKTFLVHFEGLMITEGRENLDFSEPSGLI